MKKAYYLVGVFIVLCASCGTLGGFESFVFPVNQNKLSAAIDSLYKLYPEYQIPQKWEKLNDWEERGYGFLNGKIIYFKSYPEEMYYVTIMGDSSKKDDQSEAAIRAVNNGKHKWLLEDNFDKNERKRIQDRFTNEIVPILKKLTMSKAYTTD